jgi:hypothetical protein
MARRQLHVRQLPREVLLEIETLARRLQIAPEADFVWNRLLSELERQRLGGNLETCFAQGGTIGIWMRARGVSRHRAILDIAHQRGLDDATYNRLLRETGEEERRDTRERPSWQRATGELRFNGSLVRVVRIFSRPSNIQLILDAFEDAGWPDTIPNPLGNDQQRLHQALRSLNRNRPRIRFRALSGAQYITWQVN